VRSGGEKICPAGTVPVPKGTYEGQEVGPLCVDQPEFTNEAMSNLQSTNPSTFQLVGVPKSPKGFDRPQQPLVDVNGYQAKAICELRGMRLLTPVEEAYVISGPNHSNNPAGGLSCHAGDYPDFTRDVGTNMRDYVQWGAEKLYDMENNVWEWTHDPSKNEFRLSGGPWDFTYFGAICHDLRGSTDNPYHTFSRIGLRCAAPPVDSPPNDQQTGKK